MDPRTGKITWVETGRKVPILRKYEKLAITDNAYTLVNPPGYPIERIYADHSNRLKALANTARKEALQITPASQNKIAKKHYAAEVKSLNHKLRVAEYNAPLERQAQLIASTNLSQTKRNNPGMDEDEIKKIKQQHLRDARIITGANKEKIKITSTEWHAIQAGAVAPTNLTKIISNSDLDTLKALALPKRALKISTSDLRRAKAMLNRGYTQIEVADALGVGLTTLKVNLKE